MSIMIAGPPTLARGEAGESPSAAAGSITPARQLGSVHVPGLTGEDSEHLPPGTAQPDLVRYVRVLLARFAAQRPPARPQPVPVRVPLSRHGGAAGRTLARTGWRWLPMTTRLVPPGTGAPSSYATRAIVRCLHRSQPEHRARRLMTKVLAKAGVVNELRDVEVAVNELVTNARQHAPGPYDLRIVFQRYSVTEPQYPFDLCATAAGRASRHSHGPDRAGQGGCAEHRCGAGHAGVVPAAAEGIVS
jgi:hypothetical protein